jgi:sulfofructose kinase
MAKIVCVGLGCMDYIFRVNDLPSGGGKFFATGYVAAVGGPAAVASLAAAALGHEAWFIGRLGDDAVGHSMVASLTERGVNASCVRLVDGLTTQVSSVVVDSQGERQVVNFGDADLAPDASWLPLDVIGQADVVLTDVRWPEGGCAALAYAGKNGVKTVIDGDVAPYDTTDLVSLAEYIVFSEGGAELVGRRKDLETNLRESARATARRVAVTAGGKGCYWLEGDIILHMPGFEINCVDTLGAGDTFHGAFAVALAEGMDMEQALRFSSAAAALKCTVPGGSTGIPTREQVDEFLGRS